MYCRLGGPGLSPGPTAQDAASVALATTLIAGLCLLGSVAPPVSTGQEGHPSVQGEVNI